jgi:hypothetical protein
MALNWDLLRNAGLAAAAGLLRCRSGGFASAQASGI